MNIAHLLPDAAKFPLKKHNGRYEWALRLARRQAADGHRVTVYAGQGSTDAAPIIWRGVNHDFGNSKVNGMMLILVALRSDHDIYHSHLDYLSYLTGDFTDRPIVSTQHWFPDKNVAAAAQLNKKSNVVAVPASRLMAEADEQLQIPHAGIIRQGIDLNLFKKGPETPGDRLIFVGRIAPWKGVLEAVQIAKAANQKLDIVGKLNNKEQDYWQKIKPLVDGEQIRYLGPKNQIEIVGLYAKAKALLFPSQKPEAAPQVPIEAQACNVPVIMSDIGATREWLDEGKSGFIASNEADYIEAIRQVDKLDREHCRQFAEQFGFEAMVSSYYKLYEQLLRDQARR